MSSINITYAAETTKPNDVMESTMLTNVIHNIGSFFYGPEIEGVYISMFALKMRFIPPSYRSH